MNKTKKNLNLQNEHIIEPHENSTKRANLPVKNWASKSLNADRAGKPLAAASIEQPSNPPSAPRAPDSLEKQIAERLADYPDPMSRTDFRTACRIGTRTSLYLLQSGLVPCTHTGKKTRCYKIAKADVAEYLRRREYDPHHYAAPSGWYKNYPDHKPPATSVVSSINYEIVSRLLIRQYFEEQLAGAPDVLTVAQIAQATGYSTKAVSRWCSEGRLRSIIKQPKFMVPKVWLLDFLTSNDYNNICRKSGKHYAMIREVGKK